MSNIAINCVYILLPSVYWYYHIRALLEPFSDVAQAELINNVNTKADNKINTIVRLYVLRLVMQIINTWYFIISLSRLGNKGYEHVLAEALWVTSG